MLCEAFQMRLFFSLQPVDIWRVFCCQPFEILSQSGNSPWKSEIYLNWPSFKHTHIWKSVEKCLNLRRWIFSLGLVGCQTPRMYTWQKDARRHLNWNFNNRGIDSISFSNCQRFFSNLTNIYTMDWLLDWLAGYVRSYLLLNHWTNQKMLL